MGDVTPWDFVYRWPDGFVRGRVWRIVSKLLVDGDETIRARAVEFQRLWTDGRALTTPRIFDVAEQHPELYGDQHVEAMTLRDWLGSALSKLAYCVGERVAKIIRAMNEHEPVAGSVMGRYYPDDAIALAPRFGDAHADWIEDAAGTLALYRRDSVVAFLGAICELSSSTRQRAFAAVEQYIKRDDAAAAQMAKDEGFPPPSKAAPTAEYCRRAMGLRRRASHDNHARTGNLRRTGSTPRRWSPTTSRSRSA
jgi:hypothetical protein